MKRSFAPLAIFFTLVTTQLLAREPQAPPAPSSALVSPTGPLGTAPNGDTLFVGHYGEAFIIPYGWTAEAELRGAKEIVYIHRKSHDDFGYKPFQPEPADFKLENFAPLGLMELVVVPKNAPGGLRTLSDLRVAKEKELNELGATFKINDAPDADRWPAETFHVAIQLPYRVIQTYAESPSEFYILTAGEQLRSGEYGLTDDRILDYQNASDVVSAALGNSLQTIRGRTVMDRLFRSTPKPALLPARPIPARIQTLVGISLMAMIILALFPGTSGRSATTRLFGRCVLLFSLSSSLTGFLTVYLPARFGGIAWRNPEDALALAAMATPLISWVASSLFKTSHKGRVLTVTSSLTAAWEVLLIFGPRSASATTPADTLIIGSLTPFLTGIIFASAFVLAFGKRAQATETPL